MAEQVQVKVPTVEYNPAYEGLLLEICDAAGMASPSATVVSNLAPYIQELVWQAVFQAAALMGGTRVPTVRELRLIEPLLFKRMRQDCGLFHPPDSP